MDLFMLLARLVGGLWLIVENRTIFFLVVVI